MQDPKKSEREYFARIGEEGRDHAMRKPFSDAQCIQNLANVAAFMALMRLPPARVVEFGCGSGWLSLLFAERGYDVLGLDISPDAIAMAERLKSARNLRNATFRVADYEDVQVEPPADYAVFHDALHHAESPEAALRAAYRALVPNGFVACIEPGEGHSQSPSSRHAVEAYGVHERELPPRTIIRYATAAGFKRHLVLPWPWYYFAAVYRPGYTKGRSTSDLFGRKLLSLFRFVRWFFRTREQAVVILWK
jgi:SAM-dependent methyltransferase